MKWTPQDVVAILLTIIVILAILLYATMRMLGKAGDPPELSAMWLDLLEVIVGGLIGYMGGRTVDR